MTNDGTSVMIDSLIIDSVTGQLILNTEDDSNSYNCNQNFIMNSEGSDGSTSGVEELPQL